MGLLDHGAEVDVTNDFGQTPLHRAAACGHAQTAEELLARGAQVEKLDGCEGNAPLHLAAAIGHLDVLKTLLDNGADIEAKMAERSGGATAILVAAATGHLAIVKELLNRGADRNATAFGTSTALSVSTLRGFHEVVQTLKTFGPPPPPKPRQMPINPETKTALDAHFQDLVKRGLIVKKTD